MVKAGSMHSKNTGKPQLCDLRLLNPTYLYYENHKRFWLFAFSNADLNDLWSSCVAADGFVLLSLHFQFFTAVIILRKPQM